MQMHGGLDLQKRRSMRGDNITHVYTFDFWLSYTFYDQAIAYY